MNIELKFVHVQLKLEDYGEVCIEWQRNGKKSRTKSLTFDENITKNRFPKGASLKMPNTSFFQLANGSWKPDVSTVRLICSGQVIGECYLDLTNYIGK